MAGLEANPGLDLEHAAGEHRVATTATAGERVTDRHIVSAEGGSVVAKQHDAREPPAEGLRGNEPSVDQPGGARRKGGDGTPPAEPRGHGHNRSLGAEERREEERE